MLSERENLKKVYIKYILGFLTKWWEMEEKVVPLPGFRVVVKGHWCDNYWGGLRGDLCGNKIVWCDCSGGYTNLHMMWLGLYTEAISMLVSIVLIPYYSYIRCNHYGELGEGYMGPLCNFLWIYNYLKMEVKKVLRLKVIFLYLKISRKAIGFTRILPRGKNWSSLGQSETRSS